MILNKYWSGLIYSDSETYFPRWRDNAVNRAKTIIGSDFKDGDVLIYSMNANNITAENGLYAYIYINGQFVGNNYPGEENQRQTFTHDYYENNYKKLFNGCDDNICDNIDNDIKTFLNYQTLYGKDNYVILRPTITNIIFEVNTYTVDSEQKILSNIPRNSVLADLKNNINTYGIIDKDEEITGTLKTGDIIKTSFGIENETLNYKISVNGDVTGTGDISEDAKKIAKHIIDKNIITDSEYLLAADYNNDKLIQMNDVMKLLKENE